MYLSYSSVGILLQEVSAFTSPFWFRKVQCGQHPAKIGEDGLILLEGEKLRFVNPSQALPPGTPVLVWLSGSFKCETQEAYDQRQEAYKVRQAEEKEAYRIRLNLARDRAIATNAKIKLPVQWVPGVKDVLSGLTENSNGDGRKRNTVQHIYLLEPLHLGRLKREAQDFLCTSTSGSNGKQWCNAPREEFSDGEGKPYPSPITCKKCLAIAEQLSKKLL